MDLNGNQASIGNLGPDDYIGSNSWVNSIWSTSQNVDEIKDILLGNKH